MDEEYDAIVLGTGLKECIISGVLSVEGYKVLHMDRNSYYGGDSASLNLSQLFKLFYGTEDYPPALGHNRDWNVDLIPKFLMATGKLVKILLHTDVTRYLEFKSVNGSFVMRGGKVHKVPATDKEALRSPLIGMFEKLRARKFFMWMHDYKFEDEKTWNGLNLKVKTMREVFTHFGLEPLTQEFVGHSLALHLDDSYLDRPALETVEKCQLYEVSLTRYMNSPYIYPMYGLGELPQAFARLSAVYGGTYMLNKPVEEIVYNDDGVAIGVKAEGETAKAKLIVADPSYFPDKIRTTGQVVRCICVLRHPIPDTNNADSCQIIIPQGQVGRNSDIYISCVSNAHSVAGKGRWIALVSTTVETQDPEKELAPGIKLLGEIEHRFLSVQDTFEPVADGTKDKCFISKSFDATSHFETTSDDVLDIYHRITGKDMDLTPKEPAPTS